MIIQNDLRYWKHLLSVTSKASVFAGAIFRLLLYSSSPSGPSRLYWVTPFLNAKLNALVVTQGYYLEDAPVAYP